ncbi:hypothetical protein [Sorangium cellulosum]|uniref:hypothetical protein n=1 Tax=Sorangium cellulosum TaxID=56 RepID=UPI001F421DDB|nr:hypothetical protein [Sorangium cellulosum]
MPGGGEDEKTAIERLGLSAEAGRLRRWTYLYGQRLGVTEAKSADPAIKLPALRVSSSAQLCTERSATGSPSPPPPP